MRPNAQVPNGVVRPGTMTAVMRAARTATAEDLRVGVARGGRVIDERRWSAPEHITVGSNERNAFVVTSTALPSTFRLFEAEREGYALCFTEAMVGRVAMADGVASLEALRGRLDPGASGIYRVPLDRHSRGKVVVGDTTFLFQFVPTPPRRPRPQLPLSVRRGASSLDWQTTVIAGFSFLAHFLAVGSLYSDWLDPVVGESEMILGVVDSIAPPASVPVEEAGPTREETSPRDSTETAESSDPAPTPSGGSQARPPAAPATDTAGLARELESIAFMTLAALTEGEALVRVTQGEVPTEALDEVARKRAGVSSVPGLALEPGARPVAPGERDTSLASFGKKSADPKTEGTKADVEPPKAVANVGSSVPTGVVRDAASVVAALRPRLRACYQRALNDNPGARGSVNLTLQVGASGNVLSVGATSSGNLGGAVACARQVAQNARFAPPTGGSAVVVVPVTFIPQP